MKATTGKLVEEYQEALEDFLRGEGEAALERAYESGRKALAEGLGVLDLAALHQEALRTLLRSVTTVEESIRTVEQASVFFAESLSPYELTYRGFQDVISELRQLTRTLEQRVAERTAEAERARIAAEAATRRAQFLAGAGQVLAGTLDPRAALDNLARLAVPVLADWCLVDLLEPDGRIRRVAAVHADPARQELVDELRRYAPDPARTVRTGQARVLRSGKSELIPEVTDAFLQDIAVDEAHLRILRTLGPRSIMFIPLIARDHPLGVITFARTTPDRPYTKEDLTLGEDLASRAALAVDNAHLYQEALAASEAKSSFLAVMSHELRTPLNAIIGYADLLLLGVPAPLPEPAREHVNRILASARQLLHLIEEILTFSRTETGREAIRIHATDAATIAREVADAARPLVEKKGLRFLTRGPAEPFPIETDPAKIRQILLNLISNAVKFTEEGEIELQTDREDDSAVFRVRDTGIGIPPEHLEKIFDPFWQVESARTRERGGTGLGLTVARRLARMLGGDVTVTSTPGKGSTFTLRVPMRSKPPVPPSG